MDAGAERGQNAGRGPSWRPFGPVGRRRTMAAPRLKLPFRTRADGRYESWRISQLFEDPRYADQYRDPETNAIIGHEGIDWACCTGTPIHAMAAGVVDQVIVGKPSGLRRDMSEEGNLPCLRQLRGRPDRRLRRRRIRSVLRASVRRAGAAGRPGRAGAAPVRNRLRRQVGQTRDPGLITSIALRTGPVPPARPIMGGGTNQAPCGTASTRA